MNHPTLPQADRRLEVTPLRSKLLEFQQSWPSPRPITALGRATRPGRAGGSLLVVEDDPGLQRAMRKHFANTNIEVVIAPHYSAARAHFASTTPDLACIDLGLPTGFAERLTGRDYGSALRVSFASRIDQISFKLYAAASRREPRDFADLQQLEPTPAELRDAARWARTHNMPGPFDDDLAEALADLGVEDEGRDA